MANNSYRSGKVYIQDDYCGKIWEDETGYHFQYDTQYLSYASKAISLTMPLRPEPYHSRTSLFPFFDGLIPEGYLLDLVEKNWKLNASDRFGLLIHACRDCIGDVSIITEEQS